MYTFCNFFLECNYRGVILQLSDYFITPVYRMIFKQDPPCMSQETMEALVNITDWYASPLGTFIRMYNAEKPPQVLSKFSMCKIVMQEVSYHISVGMSVRFGDARDALPID